MILPALVLIQSCITSTRLRSALLYAPRFCYNTQAQRPLDFSQASFNTSNTTFLLTTVDSSRGQTTLGVASIRLTNPTERPTSSGLKPEQSSRDFAVVFGCVLRHSAPPTTKNPWTRGGDCLGTYFRPTTYLPHALSMEVLGISIDLRSTVTPEYFSGVAAEPVHNAHHAVTDVLRSRPL